MSDTLSTIADAEKAAVASLLVTLKAQGIADTAELKAFAEEYGPPAARWGLELAEAKLAGDTDAAQLKQDDFLDLAALAAAKAADMMIVAQVATEQAGKDMVTSALATAAKIGLASLVAL